MSADARQNLKDNLKYWADLDKTEIKNDFIRLYNISLNQDLDSSNSYMISVEEFERIYQNAKDLASELLESFDHLFLLIGEPSLFMRTVNFTTKALKRNIETTDNSIYFIDALGGLDAFKNHLSGFLAQVRTDLGKIR